MVRSHFVRQSRNQSHCSTVHYLGPHRTYYPARLTGRGAWCNIRCDLKKVYLSSQGSISPSFRETNPRATFVVPHSAFFLPFLIATGNHVPRVLSTITGQRVVSIPVRVVR